MKTQNFSKFLFTVSLIAIISLIPLFSAFGNETLKIGINAPLTGVGANWGLPGVYAYELWADEVNQKGGLLVNDVRYRVKLIKEDNQLTPEGALSAANKLIYKDKCKFIIGSIIDFTLNAYLPLATKENILVVGVTPNIVSAVGLKHPYTFACNIPPEFSIKGMLKWFVDNRGIKNFYYYYPDTSSGIDEHGKVREIARDLGLTFGSTAFAKDTSDFYPIAVKAVSSKPDLILLGVTSVEHYALNTKALRELGYAGIVCTVGTPNIDALGEIGGKAAVKDIYGLAWGSLRAERQWTPEKKNLVARFRQKYGIQKWDDLSSNGTVIIETLALAMQKAGTVKDVPKIVEAYTTIKYKYLLESEYPIITVSGAQTYGLKRVLQYPMYMFHMLNGEFAPAVKIVSEVP